MTARPRPGFLELGLVTAITGVALALRIYPPFPLVFGSSGVRFQGTDAWYHMRLVDNLLGHFPSPVVFDPYAVYPGGAPVSFAPLFDLLIASVALVLGLGAPSERLVDAVGAFLPPVLGALCIVAVYVLGRRLFGRLAGLAAAGFLAVAPGPFLERTLLGYADHHCAEALFSLLTLAALSSALQRRSRLPGPGVRGSLLAGGALAAYLLAWAGGTFLVLALLAWVVVHFALGGWRDPENSQGVSSTVAVAAGVALIGVVVFQRAAARADIQAASLLLLIAVSLALEALRRRATRPGSMPLLAGAGAIALLGVAALWLVTGVGDRALGELQRILPDPLTGTVAEVQPLLLRAGRLNLRLAWSHYGVGLMVLPLAVAWLIYEVWKDPVPERTLILVWTVSVLAATLAQNRFGYYLAPAIGLVNGALLARLARGRAGTSWVRVGVAAVLAVTIAWPGYRLARRAVLSDRGPGSGWQEALSWVREQTPDPMGDPQLYRARYAFPDAGEPYPYPPGAYGTLSWWDYGHWVLRIGRRIPVANPTGRGAERAARFLTATSEEEAEAQARGVVRYVIVDEELPLILTEPDDLLLGKFNAVARWAFQDPDRFAQTAFRRTETGLRPVLILYPDYYRSLAMRLYLFGGRRASPEGPIWVVELEERVSSRGIAYQELVASEQFFDYEGAVAFAAEKPQRKLVGLNPLRSCVPLEPLEGYRLVYDSRDTAIGGLPSVRVFERLAWERRSPQ